MSTPDFSDILPSIDCDLDVAIVTIAKNLDQFEKNGLFQVDEFLQIFADRWSRIINRVPDVVISSEITELINKVNKDLSDKFGIGIITEIEEVEIPEYSKSMMSSIFQNYDEFFSGKAMYLENLNPEFLFLYLENSLRNISESIDHCIHYLRVCVQLSQIIYGLEILVAHISKHASFISEELIEAYTETYGYIGNGDHAFDEFIASIIFGNPTITYSEAEGQIHVLINRNARFHIYLNYFIDKYISRFFRNASEKEREDIVRLLDDLYDILDPGGLIPERLVIDNSQVGNIQKLAIGTTRILQ